LNGFEGPLAQLVEQLTLNQLVVGSIPTRPTNFDHIVKNLRGTLASLENDVVPWSAICAVANRTPRIGLIPWLQRPFEGTPARANDYPRPSHQSPAEELQ
jgi:hypothetical protein